VGVPNASEAFIGGGLPEKMRLSSKGTTWGSQVRGIVIKFIKIYSYINHAVL
jgi:hypothetical protein